MTLNSKLIFVFLMLLCAVSCSKDPSRVGGEGSTERVPVQLALHIGAEGSKGDPSRITEMSQVFRGMTDVLLVPFEKGSTLEYGDQSNDTPTVLSDVTADFYDRAVIDGSYAPGLVLNNGSHLYPSRELTLQRKTSSALVYAKSPVIARADSVTQYHLNGKLDEDWGQSRGRFLTSRVTFSPHPILRTGVPSVAYGIASVLSALLQERTATIPYTFYANEQWRNASISLVWDEKLEDVRLREYFQWITNDGKPLSGTGASVEYMLTYLYRLLVGYSSDDPTLYHHVLNGIPYPVYRQAGDETALTMGDFYDDLRNYLLGRFAMLVSNQMIEIGENDVVTLVNTTQQVYPRVQGIPEGAAILSWNGIRYDVAEDVLDGVAPVSSFCYPPDLRYFSNSVISTSTSDREASYTSERVGWNAILGDYRGAKKVYSDTRSVAIDQPLQYSCGMLVATVSAATADLPFDAHSTIRVEGVRFPVTGIIIGGQRALHFDFTPSSGREYFLYDNVISGVYLRNTVSPEWKTLVSQTAAGSPVYFCLEFKNNSGETFTGAEGNILPGSKFYLVGRINPPEGDPDAVIFQKDCTTRLNCVITSFENARNSIPDMEHPSLTMGVQVQVGWTQATSSYIVMY